MRGLGLGIALGFVGGAGEDDSSGATFINPAQTLATTGGITLPGTAALTDPTQTLSGTGGVWDPSRAATTVIAWYDPSTTSTLTLAMGTVTPTGAAPPAVTLTGIPTTAVTSLEIDISTTGVRGTATFQWKLNGSVQQTAQTTAATFLLGATGVTANFPVGTYTNNDVYTSNNQPTQINDRSASGYNLVDPGITQRFNYLAAGYNSKPAVQIASTSQYMTAASVVYGKFSVGMVLNASSFNFLYCHGSSGGGTNKGSYLESDNNAGAMYVDNGGSTLISQRNVASGTICNDSLNHSLLHTFDGTNAGHLLARDGSALSLVTNTSHDPGTGTFSGTLFVGNRDTGTGGVLMTLAEFVIWNDVLSAGDAASWHNYCQTKWGTP